MVGKVKCSSEAGPESHLLFRSCAMYLPPEPLPTLLHALPQEAALHELLSVGHWVPLGFSQQEALGVVGTEGRAVKSGVYSPGSLPRGKSLHSRPHSCKAALSTCPTSRFQELCLPLASSGSGTVRLSLVAHLKVLCYALPTLSQNFLNSLQWSSWSVLSVSCWDLGFRLEAARRKSVRGGL